MEPEHPVKIRVRLESPKHEFEERLAVVVGFESRWPNFVEMRAVLVFAKDRGVDVVSFPGHGPYRLRACEECSTPVGTNVAHIGRQCPWCSSMQQLVQTSARVFMDDDGAEVRANFDGGEMELRSQIAENLAVRMMRHSEELRELAKLADPPQVVEVIEDPPHSWRSAVR